MSAPNSNSKIDLPILGRRNSRASKILANAKGNEEKKYGETVLNLTNIRKINFADASPGNILAENIFDAKGRLLLKEGVVISQKTIERMLNTLSFENKTMTISVGDLINEE